MLATQDDKYFSTKIFHMKISTVEFFPNYGNFQHTYLFQQKLYRSLFHIKQGMQWWTYDAICPSYMKQLQKQKAITNTIHKLSNGDDTVLNEEIRFLQWFLCFLGIVKWWYPKIGFKILHVETLLQLWTTFFFPKRCHFLCVQKNVLGFCITPCTPMVDPKDLKQIYHSNWYYVLFSNIFVIHQSIRRIWGF